MRASIVIYGIVSAVLILSGCIHNSKQNDMSADRSGVQRIEGVADLEHHDDKSPFRFVQAYGQTDRFEIATWNIENFPKADTLSHDQAAEIIDRMDVDLIGVQEITSIQDFEVLVKKVDGYDGMISTHRYSDDRAQKVGFIYKRSELEVLESRQIFKNNRFAFPRPPVMARFRRIEPKPGLSEEFIAIVLHLKAMGDDKSRMRRVSANRLLEKFVEKIQQNEPKAEIYVLGDFNESFTNKQARHVYQPWLTASKGYHFPSQGHVQQGEYSYISTTDKFRYSMLDHIVASPAVRIETLIVPKFYKVAPFFRDEVSDHLPVIGIIEPSERASSRF
ncbi:endonuclease/exonuclease/phosphatase family protein [Pseudobacteriovorax antillogorgiicola]|uniref:Endonuclease/Exonuclease/phosphatase family protein n=1 Tax=Pseudobacteriovorax antillogorgiicola TaxID=1513793 RepID=A0A1Y6B6L4_9BACT|nr:endonuclease/exonuclease/phosphatase family protein [Pseudobacteriovorax antillogorgiicola]TCS58778.1 endonuclease/exonuclease/phosphatase family protein [Pseudobacteriovorax antillogorgiicola]SME94834.1 Endonuclease/Exonuclease/phosphatase family protein [Pseudobacteriovorax antillogorgiicola]